jgi:dTDP-glucose 4,6-dehydratase
MRILVAGGAGFIGSHLAESHLDDDHEVVVVDDISSGDRRNLEPLQRPGFTFVEADVSDGVDIEGPFDRVYNLACPASPKDFATLPVEIMRVGSEGTRHLLDLAARDGARFLQASTSEVYGDPLVHPQTEDYWGNVNPCGKRSVYDESKRFAEALVSAYQRMERVFATQALRGEPMTLYGGGSQTRSFCYVSDLVAGLRSLMESDVRQPVNIGNPTETSIRNFATLVVRILGVDGETRDEPLPHADDPKVRCPDISRARELLGWEPRVGLEEGLTLALADFRQRVEEALA